ncbi:RagB/SusD family nutrient uptake outer membrane protein [Flavivirga spongiicola]|uniref:RagB/SusD family nutrient uptake outer membrane protein n=1 Tax=Flavivirga spongiicola TaxID=421621 RepID=A0ABU7XYU6_9FLAO|nr:RagB/SusD family nutrient uptake outer membrane protein [Flavivirga sp. MEBiC05379]MDO5980949.1 RagB/SusD family nutrient uptake outer membrane protein [Flavivirga sp. MEBiC05379]
MEKNNIYMKNAIVILITILSLSLLEGCADVEFEENPPSLLSPNSFFTTESEFEAALVGTFRPLYSEWSSYDYGYDLLLASGAEDVRSDADIFKNIDRLNPNDNEEIVRGFWKQHYQCIANANTIIGNLKNATEISDQKLAELGSQAKFLRALALFNLVRFFGEVQLTTFENQGDIENLKQATVQEIYTSIVNDLKDAEEGLPTSFSEKGRPTRGAAKALLAKVYLTMAGWPIEDATKYADARDKAAEIIGGVYNLEPNFADLWTQEKKLTTPEFIFTFYGSIEQEGAFGSHMHQATRHWGNGEGGWGDYFSEERFFNAFPDSPRKDASFTSVFADGTTFTEAGVQPHIAKYRDAGRTGANYGEGFRPILRYADVLLIYAEAANMAESGPSQAAYDAINAVRQRAGLADLPSGLSQDDFDKAVLDERNWELAFEGHRWHDLVRRKMVVEVNQSEHPGVSEINRLLPKPGAQLISGILEQNPGY